MRLGTHQGGPMTFDGTKVAAAQPLTPAVLAPPGQIGQPSEADAFRTEVWVAVRDRYEAEYEDLIDGWSKLDGKAHGATTMAGIFLAAVFAASRGEAVPTHPLDRAFLAGSIVLLVGAVVAASRSLRVRVTNSGPSGLDMERAAEALAARSGTDADLAGLRVRFLRTQVNAWSRCTGSMRAINHDKANMLRIAQRMIFAGAALALLVTLRMLAG
jgi:hypothetical protein